MSDRSRRFLALGVITSATFYRPLTFWAANAWDLSSPVKPLLFGALVTLLAIALYVPLARKPEQHLAVAITIGLAVLLLMHWTMLDYQVVVLVLVAVFGIAATRLDAQMQRGISYVLIAVFGLAPLVQLVTSHLNNNEPYPIVDLDDRRDRSATGLVEDILFVIVDGYPSLSIAQEWFGHDPEEVTSNLENLGFRVLQTGWSQHTFTGLAVPSMLELQPIADPGPTAYDNRGSVFDIMRGDSLVADTLRSADYTYTHVEGGWDGDACGKVDQCLGAPLFDETMFRLLDNSVLDKWLTQTSGGYILEGTMNATDSLVSLKDVFGNGERDYVYGHLMLPHSPYVVDSECRALPPSGEVERIAAQFACVDGLIHEIAELAVDSTAVVFTADHGSHTLEQRLTPADDWTDAQVAERFSVFLAYRLPDACPEPVEPINLEVMRAAVSCAVDIELPVNHGRYLIGADNPEWVDVDRMERIQAEVESGLIHP